MHHDQFNTSESASAGADPAAATSGRETALRSLQSRLIAELDRAIDDLESAHPDETAREHLEILRALLKAQARAYLEYVVESHAILSSHTSVMYAGALGAEGVLSTTLGSLVQGGTLTSGQAAQLMRFVGERRTVIIFGSAGTGKSTLLNAFFEHVPLDERCVAIERGPDLPALRERSFCVRLTAALASDSPALFAKAHRMNPSRLVAGEIHAEEVREFFGLLARDPRIGGMATMRADTVTGALDATVAALGGDKAYARELIARVRPVFAQMHRDERGLTRLAAIWSVEHRADGELVLRQVDAGSQPGSALVAET